MRERDEMKSELRLDGGYEHPDLEGFVFDYSINLPRDQYTKTVQEISKYVGMLYDSEVKEAIDTLVVKEYPSSKGTDPECPFFKEEVRQIVAEKRALEKQLRKVYPIIWGQVSDTMKARVEGEGRYKEVLERKDTIELLKIIRKIMSPPDVFSDASFPEASSPKGAPDVSLLKDFRQESGYGLNNVSPSFETSREASTPAVPPAVPHDSIYEPIDPDATTSEASSPKISSHESAPKEDIPSYVYCAGKKAKYIDSQNKMSTVEIVQTHLGDTMIPCYTIKMPDGRQEETDHTRLLDDAVSEGSASSSDVMPSCAESENSVPTAASASATLFPELQEQDAPLEELDTPLDSESFHSACSETFTISEASSLEVEDPSYHYCEGEKAQYVESQNHKSIVEIIRVILDDSFALSYTIKMPDGSEKVTDGKHLKELENVGQTNERHRYIDLLPAPNTMDRGLDKSPVPHPIDAPPSDCSIPPTMTIRAAPEASSHESAPKEDYYLGQKAQYVDSQNKMSIVEIVEIHLEDSLIPFYTIKMPDGREKQTDHTYLSKFENAVPSETSASETFVPVSSAPEPSASRICGMPPTMTMNRDSDTDTGSDTDTLELAKKMVICKTRRGWCQECVRCETNNEFKYYIPDDKKVKRVYESIEETECFCHMCCTSIHPFKTQIKKVDPEVKESEEILTIIRPCACGVIPGKCCCYQKADFKILGEKIGSIKETCFYCVPTFNVYESEGQDGSDKKLLYVVRPPTVCGGCINCCAEGIPCGQGCCKIPFRVYEPGKPTDGRAKYEGKISSKPKSFAREVFTTDANTSDVKFPSEATSTARRILIGTTIFLNSIFFR